MSPPAGNWARYAAALTLALTITGFAAAADEPTLASGDSVSISVFNRAPLSGTFGVRADGTVSLHILGPIPAAGMTASGLEEAIESRLSAETGIPASVTVEVLEWRPVYVDGDIINPGAYGYRMGVTAGQALALAGGAFPRAGGVEGTSLDLRLNDEAAEVRRRTIRLAELHARRLRLETDAAEARQIEPDEAFKAVAGERAEELLAAQQDILDQRRASDSSRIANAEERAQLAGQEAGSLAEQQALLRQQLDSTREALANLESLRRRGLTSTGRVLDLQRSYNAEQIELMTTASFEARARQSQVSAQATVADVRVGRLLEIAREMADVRSEIRSEQAARAAAEGTLRTFAPVAGRLADAAALPPLALRIHRFDPDGGRTMVPATPETRLRPGDLVEARRGGWTDLPAGQ